MKRVLVLFLALFVLLTSACSSGDLENKKEPDQNIEAEESFAYLQSGTLRLALAGASTLNPVLAENFNNLQVLKLMYDGLFQRAQNDIVEPLLCQDYTVSPDGLIYEFTLKEGVTFHNGEPLTAKDVEETLKLILATENLYRTKLTSIASFESRGNQLVIGLGYPVINFTALLDFPVLSHIDIPASYDFSTYVPNGTGRFKVQSYKKSKELYLSVNENYHKVFSGEISDVKVYLLKDSQTAVSMFENYQIDVLHSDVFNLNEYTPKRNLSSVKYAGNQFTFLGINNQKPALLSAATRRALNGALDKDEILEACKITYAEAADLPLPTGSFWHHQKPVALMEEEQVTALLSEDGWQDADGNGVLEKEVYGELTELSLEILVNEENSTRKKLADQLKQAWQAVGVSTFITVVPFTEYEQRIQDRAYDVFIGGVSMTENFDLNFLLRTDGNPFGISIEALDQTLNALSLMEDSARQQSLFYELCDVLRNESPLIGLYFEQDVLFFDSALSNVLYPSNSDIFLDIERWYLRR